jgi:signal peptidase II
MNKNNKKIIGIYVVLITFAILIDRISKMLIEKITESHLPIQLIKNWVLNLNITYVRNKGFIFGIFSNYNNSAITYIISSISLIAILLLFIYLFKTWEQKLPQNVFICLVIGGALGNIWDRITKGYVIDFIDFYIKDYHWPTFNFADSFITVGTIALLIYILKE